MDRMNTNCIVLSTVCVYSTISVVSVFEMNSSFFLHQLCYAIWNVEVYGLPKVLQCNPNNPNSLGPDETVRIIEVAL